MKILRTLLRFLLSILLIISSCIYDTTSTYAEEANYTGEVVLLGRFVESTETGDGSLVEKGYTSGEDYEYLPDQLEATKIYRFEQYSEIYNATTSSTSGSLPENITTSYALSLSAKYSNVILEESFFEENFEYGVYYRIEFYIDRDEVCEVKNIYSEDADKDDTVSCLTLYDEDTGEYLKEIAEVPENFFEWMEYDSSEEIDRIMCDGYLEEVVDEYTVFPELIGDGVICNFRIIKNNSDKETVRDDYIYVFCGRDYYEKYAGRALRIAYSLSYGMTYEGESVYSLYYANYMNYSMVIEFTDEETAELESELASIEEEENKETSETSGSGQSDESESTEKGSGRAVWIILIIVAVVIIIVTVVVMVRRIQKKNKK